MSDDYDDQPRRPKKRKKDSDNSSLKIILIVVGSLAGLALVSCCGAGTWLYFAAQKFIKDVDITNPADIQRVTAEMTDITIPPEFVPPHGSSTFIMKMVQYQWCPTGTCQPNGDDTGMLILTAINLKDEGGAGPDVAAMTDEQFSDANLKQSWKDYTKTEHEFDIRGKKCKFVIIQGEQKSFSEDEEDAAQPAVAKTGGDAADADGEMESDVLIEEVEREPKPPGGVAGVKSVQIHGTFPGKEAECTLNIHLTPETYHEEKILGMLRSIK